MRPSRSVRQTAYAGSQKSTTHKTRRPDAAQVPYFNFARLSFRDTGKPRLRARHRDDHCTPEKYRMECVGKTCCAATEFAACRIFVSWSWRRDLNPWPSDYKSDALPTELRQQFRGKVAP